MTPEDRLLVEQSIQADFNREREARAKLDLPAQSRRHVCDATCDDRTERELWSTLPNDQK